MRARLVRDSWVSRTTKQDVLSTLHPFLDLAHTKFRSLYLEESLETSFSIIFNNYRKFNNFPSAPILQMRKLRPRKKGLVQAHTVS